MRHISMLGIQMTRHIILRSVTDLPGVQRTMAMRRSATSCRRHVLLLQLR